MGILPIEVSLKVEQYSCFCAFFVREDMCDDDQLQVQFDGNSHDPKIVHLHHLSSIDIHRGVCVFASFYSKVKNQLQKRENTIRK